MLTSRTTRLSSNNHGVSNAENITKSATLRRRVMRKESTPNTIAVINPAVTLNNRAAKILGPVNRKIAASR